MLAEPAHQLFDQAPGVWVGHHPVLHRLGGTPDLGIAHQTLGHPLELRRHVLHRGLLGDLEENRLAGRRGHRLDLGPDHLDALAAEAFAFHAAVADLPAQAVEGGVDLGEVDRMRAHSALYTLI